MKRSDSTRTPLAGLRDLPLLKEALLSPEVKIVRRQIDQSWFYAGLIPHSVSGFNPFERTLFISEKSAIAEWIDGGMKNDRSHNERDLLVHEALFLVHDFLHCWAVMAIQEELPDLRFGTGRITKKSVEDFAFCHLLTEAVATVGLDYWFLSAIDLNEQVDLGTRKKSLTVSYRESDLPEFQKFNPSFEVQTPAFFRKIANFYANGIFDGFTLSDIRRSPKLLHWIEHELDYGQKQREYTRSWLAYLSNGEVTFDHDALGAPSEIDRPWKKRLIEKIGVRLWRKVKAGERESVSIPYERDRLWQRDPNLPIDFRFTNLRSFPEAEPSDAEDFDAFFYQFVSAFRFETFPEELRGVLGYVLEKKDLQGLRRLFATLGVRPVSAKKSTEPANLFFMG